VPTPEQPPQAPQAVDQGGERQDYARVEKLGTKRAWQMFLEQYPNGFYANLARESLAAIERAEQAEKERATKEQAEQQRLAAERARVAAEQAEKERLAKEQAEKDRLAKEQAEKDRLAKEQAEQQRLAAERARLAEQAEKDRVAKEQAEKDRLAKEQAERERLAMLTPPTAPSPTTASAQPADTLLASALVVAIKNELHRLGCYSGALDDQWTSVETISSLAQFAKYAKLSAVPTDPNKDLLGTLRGKSDRVCPLQCGAREVERNGQCVAKTCPSGAALDDNGDCAKAPKKTANLPDQKSAPAPAETNKPGAVPYDPNDRSRQITPGGMTTCGPNGCERVPAGCYAVRGMAGGHGLGGKIICGNNGPAVASGQGFHGRGRGGYNPDGSRRGYGPN